MNQFWKEIRLAAVMGLLVPGLLLCGVMFFRGTEEEIPVNTQSATVPVETVSEQRMIPVLCGGVVSQMELNEYLTGVILAEMPASFEEEALKAQAVVARTYAIRSWERGTKHSSAAVCTDSSCCQGFISEADYLAKGGSRESVEKMRSAVEATADLLLTFEGKLIEATYFSCSGGSTEDAVAVWGTEVPYLQAVESPGEENATYFTDIVTFTASEFSRALSLSLQGNPGDWFGKVTYTDGGGVDTMVIGSALFSGTQLRSALALRSTAFTVSVSGDIITIRTKGYGHRVGMSQYGADAMAASGYRFDEILAHYYQGTQLEQWIH